jgi:hypothetical protein
MTQNTNFKTTRGETQNYDLFKRILLKSIISRDSISLRPITLRLRELAGLEGWTNDSMV